MRGRGSPPPECEEMVQEILLKLPARDVARCCCVSRLWRAVVQHPSFRDLHAASSDSEALLVRETREPGRFDEASVFSVTTAKPMRRRVAIPSGYSLSNVCNGLLCFALDHGEAPAVVLNPVTGETVVLPKAPPLVGTGRSVRHLFALGFSASTKEHKLFRLSFSAYSYGHKHNEIYLGVCTLGGGGWRQSSYLSRTRPVHSLPPVLVDGKLYAVTTGSKKNRELKKPDGVLVVDVATEAHRTYRLPYGDDEYHPAWDDPLVCPFEMDGRLCLAVNILQCPRRKLQFWVMTPPQLEAGDDDGRKLYWDLRYSFYIDDAYIFNRPRGTWFDDGERTLCYRHADVLYKHDTTGRSPEPFPDADCPPCDRRIQLPAAPEPSRCRWKICGGYRPSLLSPLTLAPPPSQDDAVDEEKGQEEFENALLRALP